MDSQASNSLARTALFRMAMSHLGNGDQLSFIRAVSDLRESGVSQGFLACLLMQQASRLWVTDQVGSLSFHRLLRGSADGELLVGPCAGRGGVRVRCEGHTRSEGVEEVGWKPWCAFIDDSRFAPTIKDATRKEFATTTEAGNVVYLAESPNAYELCCLGPSVPGLPRVELWRQVVEFERGGAVAPERALWVSGGALLVVLPSRELVQIDLVHGSVLGRTSPLVRLVRVFDFCEISGALVTFSWPQSEALRTTHIGIVKVNGGDTRWISVGHLGLDDRVLDAAWRRDSIVVLAASRDPRVLARTEQFMLGRPGAFYERHEHMRFLEQVSLLDGDCDGFRCVHDPESGCSFGRQLVIAHAGVPETAMKPVTSAPVLARGGSELLRWSRDHIVVGLPRDGGWRATGVSLMPEVPDVIRRGVGSTAAIDSSGTTLLFGTTCGVSAIDLQTGDPIGERRFAGEELSRVRSIECDPSGQWHWLDGCWNRVFDDDYIEVPKAVWLDPSGTELMATFGENPIGISLTNGSIRSYLVKDGFWCSSTPAGRAVFARRQPSGTQFIEVGFGDAPEVRALCCIPHRISPGIWSGNARYFVAGDLVYDVVTGIPAMVLAVVDENPLHRPHRHAVSDCGRRLVEWSCEAGYVLQVASADGTCTFLHLEDASRALSEDLRISAWAFTPDGEHVVGAASGKGDRTGMLCFWCVHSGRLAAQVSSLLPSPDRLLFGPNGAVLIGTSSDRAEIWRTPAAAVSSSDAAAIRQARARCFAEIQSVHKGAEGKGEPGRYGWVAPEALRPRLATACRTAMDSYREDEPAGRLVPLIQRQLRAVLPGWTEHHEQMQSWDQRPSYIL